MYNAGAQYQTANCVKICHLLRLSLNNNTFVALIHIDCLQPLTPTSCMLMGTVASPADTYTYIMAGQEILFSQVNGMLLRLVSMYQSMIKMRIKTLYRNIFIIQIPIEH